MKFYITIIIIVISVLVSCTSKTPDQKAQELINTYYDPIKGTELEHKDVEYGSLDSVFKINQIPEYKTLHDQEIACFLELNNTYIKALQKQDTTNADYIKLYNKLTDELKQISMQKENLVKTSKGVFTGFKMKYKYRPPYLYDGEKKIEKDIYFDKELTHVIEPSINDFMLH